MNSTLKCSECDNQVEFRWKYCRFCGNKIDREFQEQENNSISLEETEEIEEIEFDRDQYYKALSTRAERSILIKKKKEIKEEIKALLDQIKAGLIERDYAVPKINNLKEEVEVINKNSNIYSDIPEELPIEILNDQIDSAEKRLVKIEKLKSDGNVGKDTIVEAKNRSNESLSLLKDQQSKVFGHLRTWKAELKVKIDAQRREIEHLYVKFKTDEITESSYSERKEKLIKKIQNDDEVLYHLTHILE